MKTSIVISTIAMTLLANAATAEEPAAQPELLWNLLEESQSLANENSEEAIAYSERAVNVAEKLSASPGFENGDELQNALLFHVGNLVRFRRWSEASPFNKRYIAILEEAYSVQPQNDYLKMKLLNAEGLQSQIELGERRVATDDKSALGLGEMMTLMGVNDSVMADFSEQRSVATINLKTALESGEKVSPYDFSLSIIQETLSLSNSDKNRYKSMFEEALKIAEDQQQRFPEEDWQGNIDILHSNFEMAAMRFKDHETLIEIYDARKENLERELLANPDREDIIAAIELMEFQKQSAEAWLK